LLASYLRWTFTQGYLRYRGASRDWVQNAALDTIFRVNNPALLTPSYPSLATLQLYAKAEGVSLADVVVIFVRLHETLRNLRPRPIRLIRLVNVLVQQEASTAEERMPA
jgi:hypothetical protein